MDIGTSAGSTANVTSLANYLTQLPREIPARKQGLAATCTLPGLAPAPPTDRTVRFGLNEFGAAFVPYTERNVPGIETSVRGIELDSIGVVPSDAPGEDTGSKIVTGQRSLS